MTSPEFFAFGEEVGATLTSLIAGAALQALPFLCSRQNRPAVAIAIALWLLLPFWLLLYPEATGAVLNQTLVAAGVLTVAGWRLIDDLGACAPLDRLQVKPPGPQRQL